MENGLSVSRTCFLSTSKFVWMELFVRTDMSCFNNLTNIWWYLHIAATLLSIEAVLLSLNGV
jgi:hypothetical protein